ncbi:hypothetical protein BDV96DRAFT_596806 [Lophiotrema nucula]|uniref:Uncharacterized protein n=1 Tax=Lophiotrema nucula TaxID=690887 RepID=A0A6A5ZJ00_9PLEO|nr:hypothetical protein BDV96DRAFT_596806 [Lophiotrema nucula]
MGRPNIKKKWKGRSVKTHDADSHNQAQEKPGGHQAIAPTLTPGDKRRQKEELLTKARKAFPYRFGPVSRANLVVEEVGETEDDKEDYSDYQQVRRIAGCTYSAGLLYRYKESTGTE